MSTRIARIEELCPGNTDFCGASPRNKQIFLGLDEVPQSPEHEFSLMARRYVKNTKYDVMWVYHRLTYHRADMMKNPETLKKIIKSHKKIHKQLWAFIDEGVEHINFWTLQDMTRMISALQRDITDMSIMLELMDIDEERREEAFRVIVDVEDVEEETEEN